MNEGQFTMQMNCLRSVTKNSVHFQTIYESQIREFDIEYLELYNNTINDDMNLN